MDRRRGPTNERTEFAEETDSLAARDGSVYTVDWTDSSRELRILEIDAETGERGWSLSLDRSAHVGIAVDESTLYHVGLEAESGMDPSAIAAVSLEDERPLGADDRRLAGKRLEPADATADGCRRTPSRPRWPRIARPRAGDRRLTVDVHRGGRDLRRGETERAGLTPAVVSGDRIVLGTTLVLYGLEGA